jgi:two-component system nitrate/nitrite response regulator NarL
MNISVLIIDDHPLAQEGLAAALTPDPGIRIVGRAETGEEGVHLAVELRPDVIVLDLHLPDVTGLEVLARLADCAPAVRALIVTASEQIDDLVAAMSAGAGGYLTKRATPEEIRQALLVVHGGGSVISPRLAGHLLHRYTQALEGEGTTRSLLTPREEEILRLLAQGHTDREIAAQLYLSRRTVQYHLASVRRKTGMHRRSELARWVGEHAS